MAEIKGSVFAKNMTVREAFAALAMQALIPRLTEFDMPDDKADALIAKWSVDLADALIAALGGDA